MRKMQVMGAAFVAGATVSLAACTSVGGSSDASSNAASSNVAASTSAAQQSTSEAPSTTQAPATSNTTSAETPSATSSSRDVAAEISSASAAASGEQKGLVTAKVGEEAKTSKLSVKVSKVTDPVPVEGSTVFKPGAGKKWVAVTLSVTNVGSEAVDFSPMFCVDAKTDTSGSASRSVLSRYGSPMETSTLQKGDVTAGDVTFEIPSAQHLKSLDVRCSLDFGGDQRTIRVDLAK